MRRNDSLRTVASLHSSPLSSLLPYWDVSPPSETSQEERGEERRLFSQAREKTDVCKFNLISVKYINGFFDSTILIIYRL